jgi:hypothetical protein
MRKGVHIEDIETLKDLDFVLLEFSNKTKDLLFEIDIEIRNSRELLISRYNYWKNKVEYLSDIIEDAEEDEDLDNTYQKLREAEENLHEVEYWIKEVNESCFRYYHQAKNVLELMENKIPEASQFLNEKYEALLPFIEGKEISFENEFASAKTIETKQNQQDVLISGIPLFTFLLPKGFKWVNIEEIDSTCLPSSDEDFRHHASYEVIKENYKRLILELLPMLQVDPELSIDYLRQVDMKKGIDYSGSLESVYDMFFSKTDPIYLTRKKGDPKYSITSGAHRIKVAADIGLCCVPAVAVEV